MRMCVCVCVCERARVNTCPMMSAWGDSTGRLCGPAPPRCLQMVWSICWFEAWGFLTFESKSQRWKRETRNDAQRGDCCCFLIHDVNVREQKEVGLHHDLCIRHLMMAFWEGQWRNVSYWPVVILQLSFEDVTALKAWLSFSLLVFFSVSWNKTT